VSDSSYLVENLYSEEIYNLAPKVLVILPVPWEEVSEAEQLLLSKILGSVKLNVSSVHILTLKEFEVNALRVYKPSKIIAFGSQIKTSSGAIPPYKPVNENEAVVLQADLLSRLNDASKKNLWNSLREMFLAQS
jgi:DNA polymerase III psi subunit